MDWNQSRKEGAKVVFSYFKCKVCREEEEKTDKLNKIKTDIVEIMLIKEKKYWSSLGSSERKKENEVKKWREISFIYQFNVPIQPILIDIF